MAHGALHAVARHDDLQAEGRAARRLHSLPPAQAGAPGPAQEVLKLAGQRQMPSCLVGCWPRYCTPDSSSVPKPGEPLLPTSAQPVALQGALPDPSPCSSRSRPTSGRSAGTAQRAASPVWRTRPGVTMGAVRAAHATPDQEPGSAAHLVLPSPQGPLLPPHLPPARHPSFLQHHVPHSMEGGGGASQAGTPGRPQMKRRNRLYTWCWRMPSPSLGAFLGSSRQRPCPLLQARASPLGLDYQQKLGRRP